MKEKLQTIRMLLVVAMLCLGVNVSWGDVTSYTWDFTNTTTWTTAKIATGSSVNLATDGEAPEGDDPYVTFTFDGADNYGAEVKFNAASKTVSGTCLWYAYNGSISSNNISIVVPGNMQATISLKLGSNTRTTRYHLSNEADDTNHDISSGGEFVYRNTTGSSVTVTMWATNTRRDSQGSITLQNGIEQITLSEITYNYTVNAVATIDDVEAVVSTVATGKVAPSANYSVYVSRYVLHNGIYYELDDADNANLTGYQAAYTMGSADEVKKINYKAATDVVFFSEWEKATQSISNTGYYTSYNSSTMSGGWAKAVQGNANRDLHQAFTITDAGVYMIEMPYYNSNSSVRQHVLYLDGTEEANKMETKTVSGSSGDTFSKEVVLTSGSHTVYLKENSAILTSQFDYLEVRKSAVAYSVQYKCGDTTIKTTDESRKAVWGTNVAITGADKENIIYNHATYEYSSDDASTVTIASDGSSVITVYFTKVPFYTLADVTEATTWDWSVVTNLNAYDVLTASTTPKISDTFNLKDLELYGKQDGSAYSIPNGFGNAQQLEVTAQHPFRSDSYFQGSSIKFHTTVPGKLDVDFSNTGSDTRPDRYLYVNGVSTEFKSANTTKVSATSIHVSAGDVTIEGYINGNTEPQLLHIFKIVFTPYADDIINAIADCKKYETSDDFASHIDGLLAAGSLTSAEEVYAAHTAWQVENATVTDGKLDITKVIRNAAIADATDWDGASILSGEKYTGAPDDYYLDKNTGTIDASQMIYDLPAGNYVLKAATRSKAGTSGNIYVYADNQVNTNTNINANDNSGGTLDRGWSWTEVTFALTEKADVKIGFWANTTNYWASCDDWHIYKVESAKSLNAKGYSTFSSSLNLQVTGADAYTAQLNTEKGEITCKKIADGKIPAGSGVLLFGTENAEVTFTVIENAPALSDNDLKATTLADGTLATMGNNTYYVLNGDTFMQYNGNAFVAGKAYFDPSGTQARSLTMTFENEMTGIGNVQESKDSKADGCYNLAGQRVSNPTKGLYIMNGKKYIVK